MQADQVFKVISVEIGNETVEPKLGFKASAIGKSEVTKAHLQTLKHFNPDGLYFYVAIKASNPQALKPAFEEFLKASFATVGEMVPLVAEFVAEDPFEVTVVGEYVIAAVKLKENNQMIQKAITLYSTLASDKAKHERGINISFLTNKTISELESCSKEAWEAAQFRVALELVANKEDKYFLKKALLDAVMKRAESKKPGCTVIPPNPDEKALRKINKRKLKNLLFFMFNCAKFHFKLDGNAAFTNLVESHNIKMKETFKEMMKDLKEACQRAKTISDGFPFLQDFLGQLEQHGLGEIQLGAYHKMLSGEVDLYCEGIGELYKRLLSE